MKYLLVIFTCSLSLINACEQSVWRDVDSEHGDNDHKPKLNGIAYRLNEYHIEQEAQLMEFLKIVNLKKIKDSLSYSSDDN